MSIVDVLIVGSGFGGAVAAARFGAQLGPLKRTVAVLERGHDHVGTFDPSSKGGARNAQGNRMKQTLAPAYTAEVTRLFTDSDGAFKKGSPSMTVATGQGLGGGSNAYDGVSLRAPTVSFEQVRDGAPLWPTVYTRAALNPFYDIVERRLNVAAPAWTDATAPHWQLATKRDLAFAEGCAKIGAAAAPLKLADRDDANEGWWNQGQRFSGRQTLTKNYLQDAHTSGVSFFTGHEVTRIEKRKGGGYVVSGKDSRAGAAVDFSLECRVLVIASGAVGSSGLLLSARDTIPELGALPMIGKRVSANGDFGVNGVVGDAYARPVHGMKGKPMSSFCPSFFAESQFILIPFYAAPLYLSLGKPASFLHAETDRFSRGDVGIAKDATGAEERPYGAEYKKRLRAFGEKTLTMGCLALDDGEGEVIVGRLGTEVRWRETSFATNARWSAAFSAMQKIYAALGGEMYLDAYRKDGTVSTAHPLGGCAMGTSTSNGVVNDTGEVFGLPNMFVLDGGVIPSALGVNPSLTIAAVAERITDAVIRGAGTTSLATRLASVS